MLGMLQVIMRGFLAAEGGGPGSLESRSAFVPHIPRGNATL